MSHNTVFADKIYKKLTLKVSLKGFSYCISDTISHRNEFINSIDFAAYPRTNKIEEHYYRAFLEHRELTKKYDNVVVLHQNNWNTFVPQALFDEDYLGSYLQFNTKIFETDFFMFDELSNYQMNNVYVPFSDINNYLLDQFTTFDYKHANTILVEKLLSISKNIDEKLVFAHFEVSQFQLIVVQNQKLLFFNSFEIHTKEDFIYYLLFSTEQLNLNPEFFRLQFLGAIDTQSPFFEIAYRYIRNVDMFDVSSLMTQNEFAAADNLQHFILL